MKSQKITLFILLLFSQQIIAESWWQSRPFLIMAGLVSAVFLTYRYSWIKTYNKLKNDITFLRNEQEVDQRALAKLKEEKKDYEGENKNLKKEFHSLKNKCQTSEKTLLVRNSELANIRNKNNQLNKSLRAREQEKNNFISEIENYKEIIRKIKDEIENGKIALHEKENESLKIKNQYNELNQKYLDKEKSNIDLQASHENNQQLINKLKFYVSFIPLSCIAIKDESNSNDLTETMLKFGYKKETGLFGYNGYFIRNQDLKVN